MQNIYAKYHCSKCRQIASGIFIGADGTKTYLCESHISTAARYLDAWVARREILQWGGQDWYIEALGKPNNNATIQQSIL
jgi:hypothetical protein